MNKPIATHRASLADRCVNWALLVGLIVVVLAIAFGAQP